MKNGLFKSKGPKQVKALLDNYRSAAILVLVFFLPLVLSAQMPAKYQKINGKGFTWNGGQYLDDLTIPSHLPALAPADTNKIAIFNGEVYISYKNGAIASWKLAALPAQYLPPSPDTGARRLIIVENGPGSAYIDTSGSTPPGVDSVLRLRAFGTDFHRDSGYVQSGGDSTKWLIKKYVDDRLIAGVLASDGVEKDGATVKLNSDFSKMIDRDVFLIPKNGRQLSILSENGKSNFTVIDYAAQIFNNAHGVVGVDNFNTIIGGRTYWASTPWSSDANLNLITVSNQGLYFPVVKLTGTLTADRNLTIPSGTMNEFMYICSFNSNAFRWQITGGVGLYEADGTQITQLNNNEYYVFLYHTAAAKWYRTNGANTANVTYYVSPSGSNSNNGRTVNTPFQTIAHINSLNLPAGTKVLFEGGQSFTGTITASVNGTAGKPITYGSYGAGKATIIGNNATALTMDNAGNIIVKDLILKGINQPATYTSDGLYMQVGYTATANVSNITLSNLEIYGFSGSGISAYTASAASSITNLTIEDCIVHDNINGIYIYSADVGTTNTYNNVNVIHCKAYNNLGLTSFTTSHTGNGIVIAGVNSGRIEFCEAYGNGWNNGWASGGPFGIWTYDSNDVLITNSESHDNGTGTGTARKDGGGFNIDGGAQNCIIEKCYSHGNAGAGFAMYEYGSPRAAYTGNVIRNNIGIGNGKVNNDGEISLWTLETTAANNRVHNNLFIIDGEVIAGAPAAINFVSSTLAFGQLNIFNNIFIADGANAKMLNGTVQGTWSNNRFFTLNSANANYSTGGTSGDPLLRNYTKFPLTVGAWANRGVSGFLNDYKLRVTSACVNTGLGTLAGYTFPTRDFYGAASPVGTINIGPHEMVP